MIRSAVLEYLSPGGDVANARCRKCGTLVALVTWKVTDADRLTRGYVQPEAGMVERPVRVDGLPTFGPAGER